eukprot:scaffold8952_cov96-Isochrysis_galbana.AAC.1
MRHDGFAQGEEVAPLRLAGAGLILMLAGGSLFAYGGHGNLADGGIDGVERSALLAAEPASSLLVLPPPEPAGPVVAILSAEPVSSPLALQAPEPAVAVTTGYPSLLPDAAAPGSTPRTGWAAGLLRWFDTEVDGALAATHGESEVPESAGAELSLGGEAECQSGGAVSDAAEAHPQATEALATAEEAGAEAAAVGATAESAVLEAMAAAVALEARAEA